MNDPNDVQPLETTNLGGSFTFLGTSMTVHRLGYGAMQLAGPGVWGHRVIPMPPWLCCAKR